MSFARPLSARKRAGSKREGEPGSPFHLTRPELNENDIRRACLDLLAIRGWRADRLHVGIVKTLDGRFLKLHPTGTPDYVCVHAEFPGFYLETKRPGGKLSPGQKYKGIGIQQGHRIPIVVVDSAAALKEWLDALEA